MKTIFNIFLFLFLCSVYINSQVTQQWAARYHFYSTDGANDIAVDDSGNVYATGYSHGPGSDRDYATVKYNPSGVQQWAQRYNGPGNNLDIAHSIAVDDAGNVYVTGYSRSGPDAFYNDFATIKYNSSGSQQWIRRYNGGGSDVAEKVLVDNNGDILVGGWSTRAGTGPDFTVVKYNPNGDSLWVRIYDSGLPENLNDYAYAMAVDISANVYLTGSVGISSVDWATVKWNSQGVFQWARIFNGPGSGSDYPQAIAISDSGNVYVTGGVWGNNNTDCAVVKYDTAGTLIWTSYYNGGSIFTAHDAGISISLDFNENIYLAGNSKNPNFNNYDWVTIKFSSSGIQQWVSRFNGPANNDDEPCCIKLDTAGNVYVTGYATVSLSPANNDYCTIKYNNSGVQQWLIYYGQSNPNAPGDVANALAVERTGNVYVTGISMGDYATIKYSQTTGIIQISIEIPEGFKLYPNYPNPFNPTTVIRFSIPPHKGGNVTLQVFDILGRVIETLVEEKLTPGTYEVDFEASNYSCGVYYYRLITSGYTETRKMIFIK